MNTPPERAETFFGRLLGQHARFAHPRAKNTTRHWAALATRVAYAGSLALFALTSSSFAHAQKSLDPPDLDFTVRLAERVSNPDPTRRIYEPGPEIALAPNFMYVRDRALSLSAPPWSTEEAFAEAFELARLAWYESQPDRARALVVFSTFDEGTDSLFYLPLANDVRGLGTGRAAQIFDSTPNLSLDGYVWMGAFSLLEGAGDDFFREAFLHELAHRWGAYVDVRVDDVEPDLLRGRQSSHWSFFVDSKMSPMDGNDWEPSFDGTWETVYSRPIGFQFFPLDLYLMGLLPPHEVPPVRVLSSWGEWTPTWYPVGKDAPPAHRRDTHVTLRAEETTITIDQIIAANGPRIPAAARDVVVWPVGVVLLSDGVKRASLNDLARLAARLESLQDDFARATGGRMVLDLQVIGAGKLGLGEPCEFVAECKRTVASSCEAPLVDDSTICTRPCGDDASCGAGFCCAQREAGAIGLCAEEGRCPAPEARPIDPTTPGPGPGGLPPPGPPLELQTADPVRCTCSGPRPRASALTTITVAAFCWISTRRRRRQ